MEEGEGEEEEEEEGGAGLALKAEAMDVGMSKLVKICALSSNICDDRLDAIRILVTWRT